MMAEIETYDQEFPSRLGPPPVVSYGGRKLLDQRKPTYTVELDAGAFRALWELLESEAKHRFPTREALSGARAYLRAVEVFRSVYWAKNEPPAPPVERKKLMRKPRKA